MFLNIENKIKEWRDNLVTHKLTLYERDLGPVCYEAQIVKSPETLNHLLQCLMSVNLDWFWESQRERELDKGSAGPRLPEHRELTKLHSSNQDELLDDFQEVDVDGNSRFITIFGVEKNKLTEAVEINSPLQRFVSSESGPVQVILIQVSDSMSQLVYVPHQPVETVDQLQRCFGLLPQLIQHRKPYSHLYLAKIESLLRRRLETTTTA